MSESVLNAFAQQYVDLVLCKSRYDSGDIQWFTEGPFWRRTSMKFSREYKILPDYEIGELKHGRTLSNIADEAEALLRTLKTYPAEEGERQRAEYLVCHVNSLLFRTRMLMGRESTFDEMTDALYNLTAPACSRSLFDGMKMELDENLPGQGTVLARIDRFREQITISPDCLLNVLRGVTKAFHDCAVDKMHLTGNSMPRLRVRELPDPDMVFLSILFAYDYDHIQYERNFNLNYPWTVDKVMEYTGHEMEPGHLTYYEKRTQCFIDTCWPEMGEVSLYSPSSAFTEGAARYASDLCFEGSMERKTAFEREHIFKRAGLDETLADYMPLWHRFIEVSGYAFLEASRRVWDGQWTEEEALRFLKEYGCMRQDAPMAELQKILSDPGHFVCHDYARDTVKKYFENTCGGLDEKWALYETLCSAHMSMYGIAEGSFVPQVHTWR